MAEVDPGAFFSAEDYEPEPPYPPDVTMDCCGAIEAEDWAMFHECEVFR